MDPTTAAQWMAVAKARLDDARAVVEKHPHSVGGAYLAGYTVECVLKAYLCATGGSIPKGRDGHDLLNLRSQAGLRLADIAGGEKIVWLIEHWTVDWRYAQTPRPGMTAPAECVTEAGRLHAYVQRQLQRALTKRRR